MLKEHISKQNVRKELQEKRKSELVVSAQILTNTLVDHLNSKVSRAYQNQKRLDVETKRLESGGQHLMKIAEQWLEEIGSFSYALKEIGNVETWSRAIEKEVNIIFRTMEEVHKGKLGVTEE